MTAFQCFSHIPISLNLSSSRIKSATLNLPLHLHKSSSRRRQTAPIRSNYRDGESETGFFDENGVVKDMDTYLNHLSLEYDSVWDTKPSWCQPWTITLTGIGLVTCSWLILNSAVITSLVGFLICAWWYIFLYSYPKAYSDMIAERRKKITSGLEDTYGTKTEK